MTEVFRDRPVYDEAYNLLIDWMRRSRQGERKSETISVPGPRGQQLDERTLRMLDTLLTAEDNTPRAVQRMRLSLALWVLQYKALQKTKRLFDFAFALASLIFVLPVMGLTALAIKLDSPGPILYRQERVGKWGKRFYCLKFRSMVANAESLKEHLMERNEADEVVFKIRKDPRVTRVGRVIRKLSIDELPQIFNVLRGEMSIVGPRPPVPEELEKYQYEHFYRLDAVPGITGLQQVSGRSDLPFKRWVELDLIYIQQQSMLKDVEIILRTIPAVISSKGAY